MWHSVVKEVCNFLKERYKYRRKKYIIKGKVSEKNAQEKYKSKQLQMYSSSAFAKSISLFF